MKRKNPINPEASSRWININNSYIRSIELRKRNHRILMYRCAAVFAVCLSVFFILCVVK